MESNTARRIQATAVAITHRRGGNVAHVIFPVHPARPFDDQELIGHSRWHPEIPPVATVRPGETFRVYCRDWFDGAIRNDDSAEDILRAPFHHGHKLSGPFAVDGARPGALLVVDIVDVGATSTDELGPLPGQGWGYTGIFSPRNGGGFLGHHFPDAYKACGSSGASAPPPVTFPA